MVGKLQKKTKNDGNTDHKKNPKTLDRDMAANDRDMAANDRDMPTIDRDMAAIDRDMAHTHDMFKICPDLKFRS